MQAVLVLNQSYQPAGIISWQRAITLFFMDKVEIIDVYDVDIRSPSVVIKCPAVVKLHKNVKNKLRGVRFNKTNLYIRDGGRCSYCGQNIPLAKASYDHIVPKSQGGVTSWNNVAIACLPCNSKKDARTPEQAGMKLLNKPHKPKPFFQEFTITSNRVHPQWKPWLTNAQMIE